MVFASYLRLFGFFVTYFQVGYEETRQEGVKLYTALTKLKFVPGHFMDFKHFPAIFVVFLLWLIWLLLPLLVEALFLSIAQSWSGSVGYGSSTDSRRVFGSNNCIIIIILEFLRAFAYEFQNFIFGYSIFGTKK